MNPSEIIQLITETNDKLIEIAKETTEERHNRLMRSRHVVVPSEIWNNDKFQEEFRKTMTFVDGGIILCQLTE